MRCGLPAQSPARRVGRGRAAIRSADVQALVGSAPANARIYVLRATSYGMSSSFPVVLRDSMSVWARAASAKG
ncbi:hypothetical protein GCM10027570_00800 [Streptomonospora sediminis]